MIDINEYLAVLPGEKASDKFVDIELDGFFLNSIPNICIRQSYVQGCDCELITSKICKKYLNAWKLWNIFMKVL